MKFMGYRRKDGSIGIRNRILIIAIDECCEGIAREISKNVEGSIVVTNHYTCMYAGNEEIINTIIGSATNPNVSGILLFSMGCGSIDNDILARPIRESGRNVDSFVVRDIKGTRKSIDLGTELALKLKKRGEIEKTEGDISELVIGIKCGGSDTSSGLASNPSVGKASDMLVEMGAITVAGELIELITCEDILDGRAVDDKVKSEVRRLIQEESDRWHIEGTDVETMSIGNSVGGLTTLEEKSLGALYKTGTMPIQGVLKIDKNGVEKPVKNGFYLSEATHLCGGSGMHFAALGAHLILWTTGSAGFNNTIVPVIRVSGNESCINDDIDIDATNIMKGLEGIDSVAVKILDKVKKVANGEKTSIEEVGYSYCTIYQKDQRLESLVFKKCER